MKNQKECRICDKKKELDFFETYITKKGEKMMKSHCMRCEPVECPCCREETIFKEDGKKQNIKFYRFERRSFYTGWPKNKVGWLCDCGYLVAVPKEFFEKQVK